MQICDLITSFLEGGLTLHPSKEKFVKMLEKNITRIPGLCCQSVQPYPMTVEIDVTDGNKAKSTSATTQEHSAKFSSR